MDIALVTGGSGSFGKLLVDKLSRHFEVVNIDVSASAGLKLDVTNEADIDTILQKYPRVKVLVNAAAVIKYNPIERISAAEWDAIFSVNVKGTFLMIKHLLPRLKESRGVIVNVSSITGRMPMVNALTYCTSKAAMDMITRVCSREFRPHGITVFGISPAMMIDTENTQKKLGSLSRLKRLSVEDLLEREKETYPYVRGESVAGLLAYILSDKKIYRDLNGQIVNMGGY